MDELTYALDRFAAEPNLFQLQVWEPTTADYFRDNTDYDVWKDDNDGSWWITDDSKLWD